MTTAGSESPLHMENQDHLKMAVRDGSIHGLGGQVVCFTGTLSMSRVEMQALVKILGGQISTTVDSRTTLLVARSPAGLSEKLRKARERGIRIVDEATFTEMMAPD